MPRLKSMGKRKSIIDLRGSSSSQSPEARTNGRLIYAFVIPVANCFVHIRECRVPQVWRIKEKYSKVVKLRVSHKWSGIWRSCQVIPVIPVISLKAKSDGPWRLDPCPACSSIAS